MDDKEKDFLDDEDEIINPSEKKTDFNESNDSDILSEDSNESKEKSEWEFDAKAPTLDDNLSLDDNFVLNVDDTLAKDEPKQEEPNQEEAKLPNSNVSKNSPDKNIIKFVLAGILTVVVCAVLIFLGYRYYTLPNTEEKMNPGNVAVTVGDTKVSVGMYNFIYSDIVNQVVNTGALDMNTPFSQQELPNGDGTKSPADQYFKDRTLENIKYIISCYEAGVDSGITINEQQKAEIKKQLDSIKQQAVSKELGVNELIQETYGEYCGLATLEKFLEQSMIASEYQQKSETDFAPTQEEYDAYFAEHQKDYQDISMAYLLVPFDDKTEGSKEQAEQDAKAYSEEITDLDSLKEQIPVACKDIIDQYVKAGYAANAEECANELAKTIEMKINMKNNIFNDEIKNWLFDDNNAVNACSYFLDEENACYFVILKTGEPQFNDEMVYSVRHALIMPKHAQEETEEAETTEQQPMTQNEFSQEEWNAAKVEAQTILDDFKSGDMTEDSFAKIAEEYSEDIESTSNGHSGMHGGLYKDVEVGQMVPEFENWAIDDAREYGDTEIVKTDYGYHIMYFVSNKPAYQSACEKDITVKKMEDYIDSVKMKENKIGIEKTRVAKVSDFPQQ